MCIRDSYEAELEQARSAGAQVVTVVGPELADGIDDPGRLAELVGPHGAGDRGEEPVHYYVSGAPAFVERTTATVRRFDAATRLRPWRIHTDSFAGY